MPNPFPYPSQSSWEIALCILNPVLPHDCVPYLERLGSGTGLPLSVLPSACAPPSVGIITYPNPQSSLLIETYLYTGQPAQGNNYFLLNRGIGVSTSHCMDKYREAEHWKGVLYILVQLYSQLLNTYDTQDMYGFNLAGLHFIKRELENRGTSLFQDAPSLVRKKRKLTN